MRKSPLFWAFLAAICAAFLFRTSQQVTDGQAELSVLARNTSREEESIRVLKAEWGYLNQPERLEKLSRQYLHMGPMKGRQFVKISDLENRPEQKETAAAAAATPEKQAPAAEKPSVKIQTPLSEQPLAAASLPKPVRLIKNKDAASHAAQVTDAAARNFSDVMQGLGVR